MCIRDSPLASPDIIGVASGASSGAAFAILFLSASAVATLSLIHIYSHTSDFGAADFFIRILVIPITHLAYSVKTSVKRTACICLVVILSLIHI